MTETQFSAEKLVQVAEEQLAEFGGLDETTPKLSKQIRKYWEESGLAFPGDGVKSPWSAAFVSWCMKQAGATLEEFRFSGGHSEYVKEAIKHADDRTGPIRAYPVDQKQVEVGDLIHVNRSDEHGNPGTITYDQARTTTGYPSHCDIVTAVRPGVADAIGGNLHNTRSAATHTLTGDGFVKQTSPNPYISIVKTSELGAAPDVDDVTGTAIKIDELGEHQLWLYVCGRRRPITTDEEANELRRSGLMRAEVVALSRQTIDKIPMIGS